MNIVPKLEELGFSCGLRWHWDGAKYHIEPEGASDLPSPLVYVIVDREGQSVKTGRSLRQTIRERFGSTAKGMNNESTPGQNNKPVVNDLREEVSKKGPLRTFVRCCETEAGAREAELHLFDAFRGRIDRQRG